MKLVHEFKEGSWGGSLHRITAVFEEGTRIEGDWSRYDAPAFITDHDLGEEGGLSSGYIAHTAYFMGMVPTMVRYHPVDYEEGGTFIEDGSGKDVEYAEDYPDAEPE
jgi:hypothetical protein